VEAVNAADLLGVAAALAPDEVPDLDQVIEQVQAEADEAGIDGVGADDSIDVHVELRDVTVRNEGDSAAIVEFALDGTLDTSSIGGALGDLVPDELFEFSTDDLVGEYVGDSAITEVFVVTVNIDGEWYVSPMLTAGEYLVRSLNLLPGDYDEIGEVTAAGAATGEEAVAALFAGAAELDIDAVADVLSPGTARFATVFEDAIEDLLFEVPPDLLSGVEVDAREIADGRVRLDELSFLVTYYDEWDGYTTSVGAEVDDDCLTITDYSYGDRERACLSRVQPYYEPSDRGLVLSTEGAPGAVTVDLVGTVTSLALDVVTQVDWDHAIRSTDLAVYLDPQPIEAPSETAIAFDGSPSRVLEFEAAPGVAYDIGVGGEYDNWSVFLRDEEGSWQERWDDVWTFDVATPVRVLIASPSRCNDYYCARTGAGEVTLDVGVVDPSSVAAPAASTGGALGFGGSTSASVNLSAGSALLDGVASPSQWFSISVAPTVGQDLVLYVYDGNGVTLCAADGYYDGEAESCDAQADASGRFRVEVRGYAADDNTGDVAVSYVQR